ncbi:hypothetical protein PUN28_001241 [Cardiocondyla obscurior]|uniref:Protein FAM89A n=2 Tax=Cardiocondyla obscurior TaxID=286306 RepID=A0AAW2H4M9_9HYME
MQLATSQRPHPPPVPPRPSRQVVAEALKRSPRPPCPTRQAPPPPNTKPWRSDQQQQQVDSMGGRTIIYESIKECTKDCKDENVPSDKNQRDRSQARNTDRSIEDSRSENGNKVGSEKLYPAGNVPVNIVRKRNSLTEDQRPQRRLEIRRNSRGKDPAGELYHRERCKDAPGKDQQKESNVVSAEKQDLTAATAKPSLAVRPVNVSFEDELRASSSSPDSVRQVTVSHVEKCNGDPKKADDTRPAPTCRSRQQEANGKLAGNDSSKTVPLNEKSTNVPIVDHTATRLLVVDEAERKIALSDHEDSNDSDSNIHRQDWLEAGVHYSSTQITLHGGDDDCDTVNRNRINGYDHHEEERISDLDFISIQERIAMSSLQGLPPLPRSLSGFNLSGSRGESGEPPPPPTRSSSKSQRGGKTPLQSSSSRPSPPTRQLTTLDTQLAVLRREMFGLRQLDLSLLSQLWSLNESIQEFRQLLQEQEDRAPSPSPSSEEGDDTSYGVHPPPPPRRPAPTLHHRPPRPPRPPRPSASDESPSSEEYGAV